MPFDGTTDGDERITAETVILLHAARLLVHPWRWTKGRLDRWGLLGRRYCLVGAVGKMAERYDLADADDVLAHLHAAARERGFAGAGSFNDHPDTTHRMVLALLADAVRASLRAPRSTA